MALILRRAHHRVASRTRSALTAIRLRARVVIIANRIIRFCGMRTGSIHKNIIRTRVSIIRTRTIRAIINTFPAAQFLSARTRVALSRPRRTRHLARTHHRITSRAIPALAAVRLRTRIQIITARSIRLRGI